MVCTLVKMLTIMDDPLNHVQKNNNHQYNNHTSGSVHLIWGDFLGALWDPEGWGGGFVSCPTIKHFINVIKMLFSWTTIEFGYIKYKLEGEGLENIWGAGNGEVKNCLQVQRRGCNFLLSHRQNVPDSSLSVLKGHSLTSEKH